MDAIGSVTSKKNRNALAVAEEDGFGVRSFDVQQGRVTLAKMDPNVLRKMRNLGTGEPVYEGYDTALVCENGHSITRYAETSSANRVDYCTLCGAKTIQACPGCGTKIRGHLHGSMPSGREEPVPKFCYHCGQPYPWTQKGLRAAKELVLESDRLTPEEKEQLTKSVDDLVRDSPGTSIAVVRFKKFLPKAGKEIADAIRSVVSEIACEAAKKELWP